MRDNKRAQEARERAEEYKSRYGRPTINDETGADGSPNEGERQQPPGLRSPHDLDHWNDIVGQRVEEAIRQGHFDNLAGHGKPLDLSKNPFLPDDMQMANKLMENNNLIPGWIGERKSVLQAIDAFRQELTAGSAAYAKAKRALASPDEAIELATKW